jgi:2-polyprenyl-6-methoxyphenol hydroxylase-like FAD-dependent oxidoreductase
MNVGIQDAHNLRRKLAAVVAAAAGVELLDTPQGRRHKPAGYGWVMMESQPSIARLLKVWRTKSPLGPDFR